MLTHLQFVLTGKIDIYAASDIDSDSDSGKHLVMYLLSYLRMVNNMITCR